MIVPLAFAVLAPITLFVSEKGDDSGPGTEARPFRTLERADEELKRVHPAGDVRPVEIWLSGTITVSRTLTLGPEASHCTIRSTLQGEGTLSGGVELHVAFDPANRNFCVDVPWTGPVRQFFVDPLPFSRRHAPPKKMRLGIATLPSEGFYHLDGLLRGAEKGPWNVGQDEAKYGTDLPRLKTPDDAEFVANHFWVQSRMRIKSIDEANKVLHFDRKSVFRLTDDYGGTATPYRVLNVPEGAGPWNWWYTNADHKIHFGGMGTSAIPVRHAYVPKLSTILRIEGAKGLEIEGVTFNFTEWQPPLDSAGDVQAATTVPAAVHLQDCADCTISDCTLSHLGTYAVEVAGTSARNKIQRCWMLDLGAGGVKIGHGTERTSVEDCTIEGGGRLFASAVGVWIGDSGHNVIAHNRINDFYYTGISVGWTWGYGPSKAIDNRIAYNDISNIGRGELSDMGGIYTLGVSPGTVLDHNRIRYVESRGYGGWGIYLDEGSTGILVQNNLVVRTKTGSFHQHYGKDNVIRNNVFINAKEAGQLIRTRKEDHRSFTMDHNVVEWTGTDLLGSNWDGGFDLDRNVYWRTDGKPVTIGGKNLAAWQALGHDPHSVAKNPLLFLASSGVTFGAGSVATKMGIKPIDLTSVGPRRY